MMTLLRMLLATLATLFWLANFAHAQDYPNRPIKIVAAGAAGGSTDSIARIIGERPTAATCSW